MDNSDDEEVRDKGHKESIVNMAASNQHANFVASEEEEDGDFVIENYPICKY